MVIRAYIIVVCMISVPLLVTPTEGQQLGSLFPAGGQVGSRGVVTFTVKGVQGLRSARCSHPGISFEHEEGNRFNVRVQDDVPVGFYDVQAIGDNGITSSRTFFVTGRKHVVEDQQQEGTGPPTIVSLNSVVSGKVNKGETDRYRFVARRGDPIIIECWAERIDSSLRGILELRDSQGNRLAINRGYFGVDAAIAIRIPADGEYVVQLHDLVLGGGDDHFYRLDIGTGPRYLFADPPVIRRGQESEVEWFGWNLTAPQPTGTAEESAATVGRLLELQSTTVRITPEMTRAKTTALRTVGAHAVEALSMRLPGADVPATITLSDTPVIRANQPQTPETAQRVEVPVDIGGQLTGSDERHWYQITARRGEVFYVEGLAHRLGAPVDLAISIFDSGGEKELATFHDELRNLGGLRYPSAHLDPHGRWVAPEDGKYLFCVRNLIGGISADPRRIYRMGIRRETAAVKLVAVAQSDSPAGVNVSRGGRTAIDILAFRQRGCQRAIRVSAGKLPSGISCPDIWLGPGVTQATMVLSADADAARQIGQLELVAYPGATSDTDMSADKVAVQTATMIRSGRPNGSGRLTEEMPFAVAGDAAIRISANGHEPRQHHLYGELAVRHAPGGVIDVAVEVERLESGPASDVHLTAVGLPTLIANQRALIPAGQRKGYISFYLPHTLPVGRYSFAIQAETTVPVTGEKEKTRQVRVLSGAVTFEVHPQRFQLDLALDAPRKIKRGEIAQVKYTLRRVNGYISKVHTELASPGRVTDVGRLRGRGVTSVGQSASGTIQIIANDDAALGSIPFLRLYAVGVLEDEALYHGSCFLPLEIVE